ncbi:MAG: glycosyl hydrolase, partial [Acidobacteriota bacterium]
MRRAALGLSLICIVGQGLVATASAAPESRDHANSPFANLEWRNIGPVNMSGRVADVEGVAGNPRVVWVGSASGGVWKTTDGGLTFEPVFDEQPIASIGDIGVAPSNPDVVYVGTGESAVRNSVSFGNGVYKTTDGGQTWTHVGLDDTRHISKVLVHPNDPDTVWVGAVGHVSGPNEERGVFRTTDGGASWRKVLYIDDQHGVSDMAIDPTNPMILFACLWHFDRKPW